MKKTKIFAAYLPQYHETEDNNKFWGKGFTDWIAVKNAMPMFDDHIQPKVPLNNNYYDLSDYRVIEWQAKLANEYGIDGFNIYHYWFKNGKQELEKPAEILLEHKEINIKYFFSWDNVAWKRTWSSVPGNDWAPNIDINIKDKSQQYLCEFDYGDETQWEKHFNYLLNFFNDERYYKIDNKPIFVFMTFTDYIIMKKMMRYWDLLAKKNGFDGIFYISQRVKYKNIVPSENYFIYEPSIWRHIEHRVEQIEKYFHFRLPFFNKVRYYYTFDKVYKKLYKTLLNSDSTFFPSFVGGYDDTPRRTKDKASIITIGDYSDFEIKLENYYKKCCEMDKDFIFYTAWNEWGEGAYLEPDKYNKYKMLEIIKKVKDSVN